MEKTVEDTRGIKLGCALTIVALLGTAPVAMLLDFLYRRIFLDSAPLDCNASPGHILFLMGTPAFAGFFSLVALVLSLAIAFRSWKNFARNSKIKVVLVILAASAVGVLSLLSGVFWFLIFLCPG